MVTWMFGTSTPFSREIIKNLDNPVCFGRHNINYKDVHSFIEQHLGDYIQNRTDESTPLNIVFNINLNQDIGDKREVSETLDKFMNFFNDIGPNIFFCFKLLSELNRLKIPVRVCYVTSTFGNTSAYYEKSALPLRSNGVIDNPYVDFKDQHINSSFRYATLRTAQQSAMTSNISETCRVLGVNPASLNDDTMPDYAKTISKMLYAPFDDEQWNRIYCLAGRMWYAHETGNLQYNLLK